MRRVGEFRLDKRNYTGREAFLRAPTEFAQDKEVCRILGESCRIQLLCVIVSRLVTFNLAPLLFPVAHEEAYCRPDSRRTHERDSFDPANKFWQNLVAQHKGFKRKRLCAYSEAE